MGEVKMYQAMEQAMEAIWAYLGNDECQEIEGDPPNDGCECRACRAARAYEGLRNLLKTVKAK